MKKRIFIISPTAAGISCGDHLHHICTTTSKKRLGDIYDIDAFDVVADRMTRAGAIRYAKKIGAKRPTII